MNTEENNGQNVDNGQVPGWETNSFGDPGFQNNMRYGRNDVPEEDPDDWLTQPKAAGTQSFHREAQAPAWKKPVGIVCLVAALILLITGMLSLFKGGNKAHQNEVAAVDVYDALIEDQSVYAEVKYMLGPIANSMLVSTVNYYITFDSDGNMAVVCMDDKYLGTYKPYIDNSYAEEPVDMVPLKVYGYSVRFDDELKFVVKDCLQEIYGTRPTDDEFREAIGSCYLMVGAKKSSVSKVSPMALVPILIAVILLILGGIFLCQSSAQQIVYGNGVVVRENGPNLGILGAIVGALLGGFVWMLISIAGIISAWVGMLIVFLSFTGYRLLSKDNDTLAAVVSFICSLIVVIPATYTSWVWTYYSEVNNAMAGSITLGESFKGLARYLSEMSLWGEFLKELGLSYLFMIIGIAFWLRWAAKRSVR